jgi:demethylmenaquinone methyltransferase/2-methoxy-6-polyprenyl-1,4-benzoquinol methylase
MTFMEKRSFFDQLSQTWDDLVPENFATLAIETGLNRLPWDVSLHVVDLGCGTGRLSCSLLKRLGSQGRVTALDLSPAMVSRAKTRNQDERFGAFVMDAHDLTLADHSVHWVICFSAWPHFDDKAQVLRECRRVLVPGGLLVIWHAEGPERINAIHEQLPWPINQDHLESATELGELMRDEGFQDLVVIEEPSLFWVQGMTPATESLR